MESSSLPGGMFSSMGTGMLGLEMPLQQPQQQQNPQNPHHTHHHTHLQQHPQMVAFAHPDPDHHSQSQQPVKHGYPYVTKAKQQLTLSDEDEPGLTGDDSTADGKRKVSPWHRMKWTDNMVRLLIMAVFYIGDEGGSECSDPSAKKKTGGLLQKKGKWKSVSRAMMEKGFYVSPQQCEDKFNDLNKRYKRVNDILGKGTACRVVENQSLLDTMDQLSPKMKDEVRKLLNSKHLFFREMCAYHNSCGGGGTSGAHPSPPDTAVEPPQHQQQQQQHQHQHQQRCLHSSTEIATIGPNASRAETEASKMVKMGSGEEDEDDDEDYEDGDDDDDEEEVVEGGVRSQNEHGHEDDDDNEGGYSRKRARKGLFPSLSPSPLMRQLSSEVMSVLQDGTKSTLEKKQWMRSRMMQLEEQRVSYQCKAFELEKQRLKWVKFSSKKEREMEREKLVNQRKRLENERMALLLRQKEVELLEIHHQQQQQQHSSNKRGEISSFAG